MHRIKKSKSCSDKYTHECYWYAFLYFVVNVVYDMNKCILYFTFEALLSGKVLFENGYNFH